MPKVRLVRSNTMIEQDVSPTDSVAIPVSDSKIAENHYQKMIDAAGSEKDLIDALGVTKSDDTNLPLPQLKTRCKRKFQKQAEAAFAAKYSIFEVCLGIKAGSGKPAYDNMMADAVAYRQALKAAKDAIEAATDSETVISISFIIPS